MFPTSVRKLISLGWTHEIIRPGRVIVYLILVHRILSCISVLHANIVLFLVTEFIIPKYKDVGFVLDDVPF